MNRQHYDFPVFREKDRKQWVGTDFVLKNINTLKRIQHPRIMKEYAHASMKDIAELHYRKRSKEHEIVVDDFKSNAGRPQSAWHASV